MSVETRFLRFAIPEPNTGCWLWAGALSSKGYGLLLVNGRFKRAHRVSYEMHIGPIPKDLQLDHLCRVRLCVNPEHLEAVTLQENLRRGEGVSAQNARKTHCPQGHPYNGSNLYIDPRGKRYCRTCRQDHCRKRRATEKEKA